MSKLRAAVVGVGYLGRFHAQKYAAHPEVDLTAVVDISGERAEEIASEVGTTAYDDIEAAIDKFDIASVATPTTDHHRVALRLIRAGKHLLIEKPLTVTLAEADGLIAAAEEHGVTLAGGHLERFNTAMKAVEEGIQDALFIEAHRLAPFGERGTDVDVVRDLMIHDLDLALALVGSAPVSVAALGVPVLTDSVDIANARVEFANGCVANLTASRVSVKRERKFRLFSRDGYHSLDLSDGSAQIFQRITGEDGKPRISGSAFSATDKPDALRDEVADFIGAVTDKRTPRVSAAQARAALALAIDIEEHIRARITRLAAPGELPEGFAAD